MSHPHTPSDPEAASQGGRGANSESSFPCPIPGRRLGLDDLTSGLCARLEEAGCPLAAPVRERMRFETLLADLSATFVNVPAARVDAEIELALRRIVEALGIDRSGFGQVTPDQNQLVVTHSYEVPGVPPTPRLVL